MIALVSLAACSTDNEDNQEEISEQAQLVGTFDMTDVDFEEDPNDTSLNLADEIVDRLAEEDCFLVTFTFNADGTGSVSNSVNFTRN